MDKNILKAEKRNLLGRKVKKLRREGSIPANIYGKGVKSESIKVDLKDFVKIFKKVGETGIVEIQIGKDKRPVLIHNAQTDPVTDQFIHADFLQVDLKKKVTAQVPIDTTGEAPAEKQGVGTVVQYINEIEVEALPTDLPEKFELDLSKLEKVDDAILVKNIKVDKKLVDIKNDPEQILIKIEEVKEEEVEEVSTSEEEGGTAEGEGTSAQKPESEQGVSEEEAPKEEK